MRPELNGSCVKSFSKHANQHNKALSVALKKLQSRLPGFKYSIVYYYHALANRIKNPTKYGEVICCGSGLDNGRNCGGGSNGTQTYNLCSNRNDYVLFGGHHTQKTNQQLAQLFWSGAPNVIGPYNVKQFFEFV
ncbi:GDSL esterase/lipase 4-like isoform X2 [Hevea brasiliensis]|uniref:GDSL esterase/lipase 4-like isoform X2 n=1 Tax=Hevea brasiliensis TaxID=3981 RepID=UPI0025F7C16D|nr:GDSL esterase/lipase 4-like isoform X2 [Hevea brasiliensis]